MIQRAHPEAVSELVAAVRWYDAQEAEIGFALIDRERQTQRSIANWSHAGLSFTTADDGTVIRSKAIRGYLCRVINAVESDAILIPAYAHEYGRPGS